MSEGKALETGVNPSKALEMRCGGKAEHVPRTNIALIITAWPIYGDKREVVFGGKEAIRVLNR